MYALRHVSCRETGYVEVLFLGTYGISAAVWTSRYDDVDERSSRVSGASKAIDVSPRVHDG